MTKTLSIKLVAFTALALGLVMGLVGMVGATSISTQGPDSPITATDNTSTSWTNNNRVKLKNKNFQIAHSGDATVDHNTTGGNATSGGASNSNSLTASISVTNSSSCGCGELNGSDLSTAGPNSPVTFTDNTHHSVTNNNSARVYNSSFQVAHSGDATVTNNTTGGDATSGDASNTNSSSVTIDISN